MKRSFKEVPTSSSDNIDENLPAKFVFRDPDCWSKKDRYITREDIAKHARFLIEECKKITAPGVMEVFIIDSLSPTYLISRFYYNDPNIKPNATMTENGPVFNKDAEIALRRLQTDLLEEIKKQLMSEDDLENSQFFLILNKVAKSHVFRLADLHNQKHYYKNSARITQKSSLDFQRYRNEFIEILKQDTTGASQFFVIPKVRQAEDADLRDYVISSEVNMVVLGDMLDIYQNKKEADTKPPYDDILIYLKATIDTLTACEFLAQKGYVLNDIRSYNVGYNIDTGKGILFDLDGIHKIGDDAVDKRFGSLELLLRFLPNFGKNFEVDEMLVAMGMVVQSMDLIFRRHCLNKPDLANIFIVLMYLAQDMFGKYGDAKRNDISFDEAKKRLQKIMSDIEKIKSEDK